MSNRRHYIRRRPFLGRYVACENVVWAFAENSAMMGRYWTVWWNTLEILRYTVMS